MPDLDKTAQFLQTVPMFQGLQERQIKHFVKRFVERKYNAGDQIVQQGTRGIGLFIVEAGGAEAVHEHDGQKTVVNTFGPTDFFGELSLLDDSLRTASVIATAPTTCQVLTQLDFLAALREDPEIPIAVAKVLAKRLRRMMESL